MRAAGEVMRQRIVHGIQELTIRNNRPPTNRELGEYLGGKSTGQVPYVLLTRPPLGPKPPSDLHVLGAPPAFVLSQDQTLHHSYRAP